MNAWIYDNDSSTIKLQMLLYLLLEQVFTHYMRYQVVEMWISYPQFLWITYPGCRTSSLCTALFPKMWINAPTYPQKLWITLQTILLR
jgi:hypothetical protein